LLINKQVKEELSQFEGEGPKTAIVHTTLFAATWLKNPSTAALVSLAFRPAWLGGKLGELLTSTALYGATFLLGVLLAEGVDWRGGLVLGITTYASQMVVAWLVVWLSALITPVGKKQNAFSPREVWHLALAQQNGITAIVLALVLQPMVPIAVATISLAIVVVNLTQFCANWLFDTVVEPRFWPAHNENLQGSEIVSEID
jgi:hypothetical protein